MTEDCGKGVNVVALGPSPDPVGRRRGRLAAALAAALLACLPPGFAAPDARPVPGGIALVDLGPVSGPAPTATYRGRRVLVRRHADRWQAVVGIPLDAPPGPHALQASGRRVPFDVLPFRYPEQRLAVPRRYVDLDARTLARVRREQREIASAFRHFREALPALTLDWPVRGRLSAAFGLRRIYNGQPRKPHSGLDIAAPRGTPVRAPAPARVLRTGEYFFNGRSVFLDHGGGLITLYCHLERILVRPGQSLRRHDTIGTVGASGRATGPHLHWSVSLNDARVDPRLLLDTPLSRQ